MTDRRTLLLAYAVTQLHSTIEALYALTKQGDPTAFPEAMRFQDQLDVLIERYALAARGHPLDPRDKDEYALLVADAHQYVTEHMAQLDALLDAAGGEVGSGIRPGERGG